MAGVCDRAKEEARYELGVRCPAENTSSSSGTGDEIDEDIVAACWTTVPVLDVESRRFVPGVVVATAPYGVMRDWDAMRGRSVPCPPPLRACAGGARFVEAVPGRLIGPCRGVAGTPFAAREDESSAPVFCAGARR